MRNLHQKDRRKGSEYVYVLEDEIGLGTSARELKSQLPQKKGKR